MPPTTPSDLVGRVNRDLERSVLRARNGLRYVRGTHRPKLGATPKDVVWKRDKAELWRYRGGPVRFAQPLLVVTSLVSRSYILDLLPGSSTVEYLRRQGFDVFMVDWGIPDHLDADNSLETYIDEYLPRVVDAVIRESGAEELTMVGYCLGGVLATLYVNGDAGMLRQAILNLALNACQAMPHGGVLRFGARRSTKGRIELSVEDTGTGIAPEHMGRIFDLYFTTRQKGTGIGLSMVYRTVQLHDGDIEVQSTPGVGTTFRVLIPEA